jgi:hypothetical protein
MHAEIDAHTALSAHWAHKKLQVTSKLSEGAAESWGVLAKYGKAALSYVHNALAKDGITQP